MASSLEKVKKEFSRPIPDEYIELARTADIVPTAPTHGFSSPDIISKRELLDALEENKSPDIDPQNINSDSLTEVGRFLKDKLTNDTLIDLGCGDQVFVQNMAHAFGAKRYLGVDIDTSEMASKKDGFEFYRLKGDMLLFAASLPDDYGSFFIAGAEDYSGDMVQTLYGPGEGEADVDIEPSIYMQTILKEIYRATKPGSVFILGVNNTLPDPETVGFKRVKLGEDKDTNIAIYIKS